MAHLFTTSFPLVDRGAAPPVRAPSPGRGGPVPLRHASAKSAFADFLQRGSSRYIPFIFKTYNLNFFEGELLNHAIAEHVENAGVHSGDAALPRPVQKLFLETRRRVDATGQRICWALKISGPFNVQPSSGERGEGHRVQPSRLPLHALHLQGDSLNFTELATRVLLGMPVHSAVAQPIDMDFVACKAPTPSAPEELRPAPRRGDAARPGGGALRPEPGRSLPAAPNRGGPPAAGEGHPGLDRARGAEAGLPALRAAPRGHGFQVTAGR